MTIKDENFPAFCVTNMLSENDYAGLSVSLSLIKKIPSIHLCASLVSTLHLHQAAGCTD